MPRITAVIATAAVTVYGKRYVYSALIMGMNIACPDAALAREASTGRPAMQARKIEAAIANSRFGLTDPVVARSTLPAAHTVQQNDLQLCAVEIEC
jgi:hypothetical protein